MAFEYYFDFSCPYAYLASTQVEAVAARTGKALVPRPVLLGGIFKGLGHASTNLSEGLGAAKARHNLDDMRRFAAVLGVPLRMPAGHPLRTVTALRALLAVGEPFMPLAHRFFRAYWAEGADISKPEGVARILREAGHDADAVLARAESAEVKDALRQRTDEALGRGVFGVPTFFVGDALFFGQDRLGFVEEALGGMPPALARREGAAPSAAAGYPETDFWFDYSSPFTYVAAERIDSVLGPNVRWRPMLLGGLFKAVGQVDVPLFAQSEAKRRHTMNDLMRQAKRAGAPLDFPTRFPMNTILPLRMTIAAEAVAPSEVRAFSRRIFRAFWSEDQDISKPEVMTALAAEVGLDGPALVAKAQEQAVKDALRAATEEAAAQGVFGAPTVIVHAKGGPALYWGADRLELAALARAGDARAI